MTVPVKSSIQAEFEACPRAPRREWATEYTKSGWPVRMRWVPPVPRPHKLERLLYGYRKCVRCGRTFRP